MRIFVTYSHEDRVKVEHLIDDICELGHNVWYDQQLTAGHVWWDEVLEQIAKAELVVVAISPAWLRTHSCQLELSYANSLNKRILPIMISAIEHEILPEALQRLIIIPYTDAQRRSSSIAYAIQHLPPEGPLPNPLPVPPEAPLSELGRLQQQVRAARLTFDAQKSLVNHIRWHLYSPDLREVHQARRLLQELSERHDVTVVVKNYVDDILTSSDDIDTERLQPNPQISDLEEATNPKPLGVGLDDQRRLDVSMPSEAVVGQPTQLWIQLCLPTSVGFRNELANIPHSGIPSEASSQGNANPSRKPVGYPARRSAHVQFEITAMGFQIDESYHDVLVPADQDAGMLTITLMPDAVISTAFVRVTAKRLVTKEKYVTLGSVAVSVHIHDTATAAYASKKWVLRSLMFAASVLFDDTVQAWGIQQSRLETPPTPWSKPMAPVFPERLTSRPTIQTQRIPPTYLDATLPASRVVPPEPARSTSLPSQFWLIGGVAALVLAVIIGGLIALWGGGSNSSRGSVSEVQASSASESPTHGATEPLIVTTPTLAQSDLTITTVPSLPPSTPATVTASVPTADNDPPMLATSVLPQIRLRYTAERFTLENITGNDLDISPLSFVGERTIFVSTEWLPYIEENSNSNLLEFPSRGCVHVIAAGSMAPNSNTVIGCVRVNAYVAKSTDPLPLFWYSDVSNPFTIRWYGQTLATCPSFNPTNIISAEITCEFSLPN